MLKKIIDAIGYATFKTVFILGAVMVTVWGVSKLPDGADWWVAGGFLALMFIGNAIGYYLRQQKKDGS